MEAMDLMDPRRRLEHKIRLMVGYVLVGIALLLLTTILLFVAYGFGLQNGRVIQNGLLFLSSNPNPAQVYLDGSPDRNNTNTRLVLPAGIYNVALKRAGYRDWTRAISVSGGEVESYAYPLLFPSSLTTNTVQTYAGTPALVSESGDQHWLLVARPASLTSFDIYDLTDITKPPTILDLPIGLLATSTEPQSLQTIAWADDNDHLLLKHVYGAQTEYLLVSRSAPDQSRNLTKTLGLPTSAVDLRLSNEHYNQFVVLDTGSKILFRASLDTPVLQPYRASVLAFATYQDNTVLYVTPDVHDSTKADVMLFDGTNTYAIRSMTLNGTYLLATADFSGDMYAAVANSSENMAYVYKNPVSQLQNQALGVAVPVQVFNINQPNYVAFSANGQYALFENGTKLVTYDADNTQGFSYTVSDSIDAPATHAAWMDSARLYFVSRGQIVAFDYDGQNRQILVSADPRYPLTFDNNEKFLYALVPAADKSHELLTATSLRTPADQ